ncbi:erythromycin esterase family protein [Myroides sp. LJL116]
MKKPFILNILTLLLFVGTAKAQEAINLNKPKSLQPIVELIKDKKVVALGEATHGTKELNQVRFQLIKQLVDKGFDKIIFETSYGDMYRLNQAVNSDMDIQEAMRSYLLSLWQNKEVEELLTWVRQHNKKASTKVELMGVDINFFDNSIYILQNSPLQNSYPDLLNTLSETTQTQDFMWSKSNDQGYQMDFNAFLNNGLKGYKTITTLDSIVKANPVALNANQRVAIEHLKYGFSMIEAMSRQDPSVTRDAIMANMVMDILQNEPNSKAILWAHDGHIALKPLVVDPIGMYLKERLKTDYYALGSLVANGTVSLMEDQIDTRDNTYKSYPLPALTSDSWNSIFSHNHPEAFFINLDQDKTGDIFTQKNKLSMVGYNVVSPEIQEKYYTFKNILLSDYFDGIIFIKNTTAAEHINWK